MADGLLRAAPSGGELTLRRLRVRRVDPLVFAVQDLAPRPLLELRRGDRVRLLPARAVAVHVAVRADITLGFDKQPWLTWVLPVAVVVGLLVLGLLVLGIVWCCKKRRSPSRSGRSRSAQIAPSDA